MAISFTNNEEYNTRNNHKMCAESTFRFILHYSLKPDLMVINLSSGDQVSHLQRWVLNVALPEQKPANTLQDETHFKGK